MSQFSLVEISEKEAKRLNDFVLQNEHGSIHQLFDWAGFQQKIPGRSVVRMFGVKGKSQEFLATVLCVRMETGLFGKSWWYSPRGPVFSQENSEAGIFLLQEVRNTLKQTDGMFWRIDPYQKIPEKIPGIFWLSATQDYQPTDTLELDLTKSDDDLLADMKRKGRYNIRLASKKGVTFSAITGKEFSNLSKNEQKKFLGFFWDLNQETFSRDGFSGHEKAYYQKFLESLSEFAVLFFAWKDDVSVATAISTFTGKKAIYYFGASTSDPEYRNLMAPYGLQWYMIQYAKERMCTTYDFLGIAPEGVKNHPYSGISEFKWKFGGYRKTYPKGKEMIFRFWWYWVYRIVKWVR